MFEVEVKYTMQEVIPVEADDEAQARYLAQEYIREEYNTILNDLDIISVKEIKN